MVSVCCLVENLGGRAGGLAFEVTVLALLVFFEVTVLALLVFFVLLKTLLMGGGV